MSKEKRDKLFRKSRPFIRQLNITDGDKYHKDIGILWVAHQKKRFKWMDHEDQQLFANRIAEISKNEILLLIEDDNANFKSGRGPVCLMSVRSSDNWKFEPHAEFFSWSTVKNKLRVVVAFLQWIRYRKDVGACVVYSLEDSVVLFDKCCEYGVLHRVGRIVNGDPRGDETMYSVRGKKCQAF